MWWKWKTLPVCMTHSGLIKLITFWPNYKKVQLDSTRLEKQTSIGNVVWRLSVSQLLLFFSFFIKSLFCIVFENGHICEWNEKGQITEWIFIENVDCKVDQHSFYWNHFQFDRNFGRGEDSLRGSRNVYFFNWLDFLPQFYLSFCLYIFWTLFIANATCQFHTSS